MNSLKPCVIFFVIGDKGPPGTPGGYKNKLEYKYKEGNGKLANC